MAARTPPLPTTCLAHVVPRQCRKRQLLLHLHSTRQQVLRMLVLTNWHQQKFKALSEMVEQDRVLDVARRHVETMRELTDNMRKQALSRIMTGSYLNMFDVNTALEVLTTGAHAAGASMRASRRSFAVLNSSVMRCRPACTCAWEGGGGGMG